MLSAVLIINGLILWSIGDLCNCKYNGSYDLLMASYTWCKLMEIILDFQVQYSDPT